MNKFFQKFDVLILNGNRNLKFPDIFFVKSNEFYLQKVMKSKYWAIHFNYQHDQEEIKLSKKKKVITKRPLAESAENPKMPGWFHARRKCRKGEFQFVISHF